MDTGRRLVEECLGRTRISLVTPERRPGEGVAVAQGGATATVLRAVVPASGACMGSAPHALTARYRDESDTLGL